MVQFRSCNKITASYHPISKTRNEATNLNEKINQEGIKRNGNPASPSYGIVYSS